MNYLKLRVYVTNVKQRVATQVQPVPFAMPPLDTIKIQPDSNTKPLVQLGFITGQKMAPGERQYLLGNGQEFYAKTSVPPSIWTGYTFRFKVASCSCKGHYSFSFNVLEVLTEEEYNNLNNS